jgi:hypothetical protein
MAAARAVGAVRHGVERLDPRRWRPIREDQPAAQADARLPGDHELAVGGRQQQAVTQQPARRLRVGMPGEAAVVDAHDRDRARGGQRLVEQAPGGLAGDAQDAGEHGGIGQPGAHHGHQLGLARARRHLEAEPAGDAVELLHGHGDLGKLGDGRTEPSGVAERRAQAAWARDDPAWGGDGQAQLGEVVQPVLEARAIQPRPRGLGERGHGGGRADDSQQLGELQRAAVEHAHGGRQRRRAAGTAGQLGERRRRRGGEQVAPALEHPGERIVGERRQRGGIAGHAVHLLAGSRSSRSHRGWLNDRAYRSPASPSERARTP